MSETTANPSRTVLYAGLCTLMGIFIVAGFGPGYVGTMLEGTSAPLILHFHAFVFIGWMVLFTTQALLPSLGRVDLHRRLGRFATGYAVFLVVVGVVTTFNRFAFYVGTEGEDFARAFLIHPLSDMVVFPIFFAAAIAYRHRPEIHKRLMLVATTMLTIAAVSRMSFLGTPPPMTLHLAIWLSPIYLAMAWDFWQHRIVHPVYVIGLITLAIVDFRALAVDTVPWQNFAGWVQGLVT